MLLAIDIGNTHTVLGLYSNSQLEQSWRLQSDTSRTVDEYALEVLGLLMNADVVAKDVSQIVISCVVPTLSRVFSKLSHKYFSRSPIIIGPGVKTGMQIEVDDPRSVGADRIVNAVSAKKLFGAPVVVVDFGTATTFDVVGANGAYQGGIICPGLLISAEALSNRAAKLPTIELKRPKVLIGANTHDSMASGIIFGYASLVQGMVERIRQEISVEFPVVATGGLAQMMAEECPSIDQVIPDLTLKGLQFIAELNA